MSCKDCDAYCINAGEEDAVSCEGYIPKSQTNADSNMRIYSTNRTNSAIGGEKMTNGDAIRSMTDEELAEWFIKVQDDVADYYDGGHAFAPELPTMENSWLDWLKQESK